LTVCKSTCKGTQEFSVTKEWCVLDAIGLASRISSPAGELWHHKDELSVP